MAQIDMEGRKRTPHKGDSATLVSSCHHLESEAREGEGGGAFVASPQFFYITLTAHPFRTDRAPFLPPVESPPNTQRTCSERFCRTAVSRIKHFLGVSPSPCLASTNRSRHHLLPTTAILSLLQASLYPSRFLAIYMQHEASQQQVTATSILLHFLIRAPAWGSARIAPACTDPTCAL